MCIWKETRSISIIRNAKCNGLGTINLTGYDYGNVGLKGYYISAGTIPSEYSEWTSLNNENKATETQPAGTYFIWVMNNKML